jgi:hypothetical protein
VSEAKRMAGMRIVTPDWLWACAERWEKVDERLYPLGHSFFYKFTIIVLAISLAPAVLWIRDVYPGSEFFLSRIRIKELKYFYP